MADLSATPVSPEMPVAFPFRHYPQLDGLRAVSIGLVIAGHAGIAMSHIELLDQIGSLGVSVFFVLSGFLITGLLHRERARTSDISIKDFYVRRALRILPASLTYIACVGALVASGILTDTPWRDIFCCLLYVRNIVGRGTATAHLWSLSLEEQFYAVWPLAFRFMPSARALRITIAATCGIVLIRTLGILFHVSDYRIHAFYVRPYYRFDAILIGCCIALWTSRDDWTWGRARAVLAWTNPWILAPLLMLWTVVGESIPIVGHVSYLTVQSALVAAVVTHFVIAPDGAPLVRVLSRPGMQYVGRLSYSLYLWQQLFILSAPFQALPWTQNIAMRVVLSIVAALFSYHLVERPFLRWKSALSSASATEGAAKVAPGVRLAE